MAHSGNTYLRKKLIYATSKRLRRLVLYGPPGAKGYLLFTVIGRHNIRSDKPLRLRVYFRLRHCHLGFEAPVCSSVVEVRKMFKQ